MPDIDAVIPNAQNFPTAGVYTFWVPPYVSKVNVVIVGTSSFGATSTTTLGVAVRGGSTVTVTVGAAGSVLVAW